jgi:hypothetical protein
MSSADPSSQLLGYLAGGSAGQVAGAGLNIDQLMAEIGMAGPETNAQVAQMQQAGAYQQAQAGIGFEQLGLQSQGLAAQAGLEQTQYGLQQQGLAGREKLAGIQHTLAEQDFAQQKQQQDLSYKNQQAATQGQVATSGALYSPGQRQQVATQAAQNKWALAGIGRAQQGEEAQYGFQQQQFGLEQLGEAAQQKYSMGEIARGQSGLALTAQQQGLSLDQAIAQMNYGIGQAGLAGQQNLDSLYGQLGQAQGQQAGYQGGALGYYALLHGGVNLNAALSGGG